MIWRKESRTSQITPKSATPRFHSKLGIHATIFEFNFTIFLLFPFPAQKQKHGEYIRHHFPIQQSLCQTLWSLPSNQERVTLATKLLTHSISYPPTPHTHTLPQCSVITECQPRESSAFSGLVLPPHFRDGSREVSTQRCPPFEHRGRWCRQSSKTLLCSASSWFSNHNWRENKWPAHNSVSQEV